LNLKLNGVFCWWNTPAAPENYGVFGFTVKTGTPHANISMPGDFAGSAPEPASPGNHVPLAALFNSAPLSGLPSCRNLPAGDTVSATTAGTSIIRM
jgi:hypothetical protein